MSQYEKRRVKMKVIYRWYCDCCAGYFYTDFDDEPESCPYCKSNDALQHSKDFEVKPIKS
jgi:rubrerythrin